MNQDEIKSNLLDGNHWLRILFMVCFGFAAWVVLLVLGVLVVVQLVISLVSGSPNINLQKTGHQFSRYLQEIIEFLLYNRHDRPFPFADFPSAEGFTPPPPPPRAERPAPAPTVPPVVPVVNPAAPAVDDPAVAPAADEVAAPVGDIADPVVDIVEPVDVVGPVVDGTEPVADVPEPVEPVPVEPVPVEPVVDATEPVVEVLPAEAPSSGPAADDSDEKDDIERNKLP